MKSTLLTILVNFGPLILLGCIGSLLVSLWAHFSKRSTLGKDGKPKDVKAYQQYHDAECIYRVLTVICCIAFFISFGTYISFRIKRGSGNEDYDHSYTYDYIFDRDYLDAKKEENGVGTFADYFYGGKSDEEADELAENMKNDLVDSINDLGGSIFNKDSEESTEDDDSSTEEETSTEDAEFWDNFAW